MRDKVIEFDFSWIELQGRSVKGSTLTAHKIDRVINAPKTDEITEENPSEEKKSNKTESEPEKKIQTDKTVNPSQNGIKKDQVTFDFDNN